MTDSLVFIFTYFALIFAPVIYLFKRYFFSPMTWFYIFFTNIAIGTFLIIDFSHSSDILHAILIIVAIISYSVGLFIFLNIFNIKRKFNDFYNKEIELDSNISIILFSIVFILSSLVVLAYYNAVGYNLALNIIFEEQIDNFSSRRLNMYSGETYFFPGYVNQFKNILLPLTFVVIATHLSRIGRPIFLPFLLLIIFFIILSIVGTGQRAYLVHSSISIMFGFALLLNLKFRNLINKKYLIPFFVLFIVFYFITSAYSTRASDFGSNINVIFERFFYVQQEGGLTGFRYIYDKGIFFLKDWYEGFVGLLPYIDGSSIAHEIHFLKYGSSAGTVPLTHIGSAYYNGGFLLVVIFFTIIGIIHAFLFNRLLIGRKTIARCIGYGFLFHAFGAYLSGGPVAYIDNGLLAIILFLLIRKIRISKKIKSLS
jgi:oligosaccharide repeat unit polymerase